MIDHPSDVDDDRNELAGDRTMLANERTLAAWWRTAMAAVAAAVAFSRFFDHVQPEWMVKGAASCLSAFAFLILAVAFRRYRATARRLEATETVDRISSWALATGSLLLAVAAAIASASIWLFG